MIALQGLRNLPGDVVNLQAKIPVFIRAGFAGKCRGGQDGRVRRGQGKIEEEGLLPARAGVDEAHGFFRELRQDFRMLEVRGNHALAPVSLALVFWNDPVRHGGCRVVFNINVGRHVKGGAYAVEIIKAEACRAVFYRPAEINIFFRPAVLCP